jgi:hypothetical protein
VAIPFILDQTHNVDNYVAQGFALRLDFESLTKEKMLDALRIVMEDTR